MNIHEDERMKPDNWIPPGWIPVLDQSRTTRQGYEGGPAQNIGLHHACWDAFLSH